jgi:hypothetical protein
MADIRGRVLELKPAGNYTYAYLYGFRVNRAELRRSHKTWLWENLITEVRVPSVPPLTWHVWLSGTTSRTGSWGSNHLLSEQRATAVATHLESSLGGAKVHIHKGWVGELFAALKGRPDNFEHPLDRAVIIAFQAVGSRPAPLPPPPVTADPYKNNPCCYVQQEIEYLEAVRDVFLYLQAKGKAGSLPQQDFEGEPYGPADVPRVALGSTEQHMLQIWLRGKGWTEARARELSQDSTFTVIRIDGLHDHIRRLGGQLDYLKGLLSAGKCSGSDPFAICHTGHFRKT